MNLTTIILTILGIIFSRDIYLLLKRFLKLVDERLFFLAGIIKKVFKYLLNILIYISSNIFNYLDKKFKLKKFLSLLESLLIKIWNFDDYLKKRPVQLNNFGNGLFLLLITSLFLIIKLLKCLFWLAFVVIWGFSPIILAAILINLLIKFTPQPIAFFIDSIMAFFFNNFGNGIFSVFLIGISIVIVLLSGWIGFAYLISRYFGPKKKITRRNSRLKKES